MELTYSTYLQLDRLLNLQEPRSSPPEHDETLFIVIHQVYELWFKLILHEFDKVNRDFSGNQLYGAIATFKRIRTVLKTLVGQLDILETMTPLSFSSFRHRLDTASGFQSVQFRELEFVLGYKRAQTLAALPEGSAGPGDARAAAGRADRDRPLLPLPAVARAGRPPAPAPARRHPAGDARSGPPGSAAAPPTRRSPTW